MRVVVAICWLISMAVTIAMANDEACRIRVHNEERGLIQISVDKGRSWSTVGRVISPANARIVGFWASSYAPHGTVAATATHGIRVKTGQYSLGVGKTQKTMLLSIEPLEFAKKPSGFGGHTSRSSGIYTDIYAGHSIFRNLSPYVGSVVYLEDDHRNQALPDDYTPIKGDTYVIVVTRPDRQIASITFENRARGKVTVNYRDGSSNDIASVVRPVKGVGRYDGTTFTGVGAVNTNHCGVLTISTAPARPPLTQEGGSVETRGGFMIQPAFHASQQGEQSPQVMVIGPADGSSETAGPKVEGTEPLFFGNINLTSYKSHPENSFRTQLRIDDGDWENMPEIVGRVDNAFTPAYLNQIFSSKKRNIMHGVTAIRLLFPEYDVQLLRQDLAKEAAGYAARVSDVRAISGTVAIKPRKSIEPSTLVEYYLDGNPTFTCSGDRAWQFDTTKTTNGLHEVEIIYGRTVERRTVMIRNSAD